MQPFLDYYLKDGPEARHAARAGVRDRRESMASLRQLAPLVRAGCPQSTRNLYLLPGGKPWLRATRG